MVKKNSKSMKKEDSILDKSEKVSEEVEDAVEEKPTENGETVEKKPASKKPKTVKKSKPVTEPERKSSRAPKPVIREGGQEEAYEVEKVVSMRVVRGQNEYLVRWRGYSRGDDTWESESSLANCSDLLQKYKADNPDAGKKSSPKKRVASKSPAKTPKKKSKPTPKKIEKDYEVEDIVGMRDVKGKKEFKIRWKGYKASDDSWEPEKHLDCQDLIQKYVEQHKDDVVEDIEETKPKAKTPAKKAKKTPAKSKKGKRTK